MRKLTSEAREQVQQVIAENIERLRSIANFVAAEPGFPIVGGEVLEEPAIVVFVSERSPQERAPRQMGGYRVAVMQADPYQQLAAQWGDMDIPMIRAERATYTYEPIAGNPIDKVFTVKTPFLCHVGPDDGYLVVLQDFLDATRKTLAVSIYDFDVDYIAQTLIALVRDRDVKIALNWDDSFARKPERDLFAMLADKLGPNLDSAIVKTGPGRRFENSYHEKVAVRDSEAFWLSSGNWTENSQPKIDPVGHQEDAKGMYGKYNREWHVVVDDKPLAKVFEKYIKYDLDGSKKEAQQRALPSVPGLVAGEALPDLFVPIDTLVDPRLLAAKPKTVKPKSLPDPARDVEVQPVLTPDNYLKRLREMLNAAESSIYIQVAYITYSDAAGDEPFTEMLHTLGDISRRRGMTLRIILGFSKNPANTARTLVQEAGFKNLKIFRRQGNIHNKGIVVDGKTVLVSSVNWSSDGVLRNRDAGLIIRDPQVARFYQRVFTDDWNQRAKAIGDDPPVRIAPEGLAPPPGMARIAWNEYFND